MIKDRYKGTRNETKPTKPTRAPNKHRTVEELGRELARLSQQIKRKMATIERHQHELKAMIAERTAQRKEVALRAERGNFKPSDK